MDYDIKNIFFIDNDYLSQRKAKSQKKDLFSLKLGNTFIYNKPFYPKLPIIKNSIFNNVNKLQKNFTNILLSFEEDSKINKIVENLKMPTLPKKEKSWYENKMKKNKTLNILNDYTNSKYTKKEIKEILEKNSKLNQKITLKKFGKISELNDSIEKINNKGKKDNKILETIDNINTKNIFDKLSYGNIYRNLFKKERTKINLNLKKFDNFDKFKKLDFRRNKSITKNQIKINVFFPSINNTKESKDSIIFLKCFYEDFIDIFNSYYSKIRYNSLINNFNKTYIFLFDIKSFPKSSMNNQFLITYKFSCILIVCLIFLSKDDQLYNDTLVKMGEYLEKFIFLCLNTFNYRILDSSKINSFINNIKNSKGEKTLNDLLNIIITLLFDDKLNDYKKLRKCLKQLLNNINNISTEKIFNIINNCILYCNNCSYFIEESYDKKKKKKKNKNDSKNDDNNSEISNINGPYIKKKLKKKFCLVLDLDETLIHNLNLPFGSYFFVRPGVFDFLEKIHEIYEIIIFTAAKKNYARNIIYKIDYNNYINHLLYKKYVIYEDGNPVKKLDSIGRDINKIIFVDNLECNAKYNKKNLYLISSWYNDIFDKELYKLKEKLINIANSGKYDDDITKGLLDNEI